MCAPDTERTEAILLCVCLDTFTVERGQVLGTGRALPLRLLEALHHSGEYRRKRFWSPGLSWVDLHTVFRPGVRPWSAVPVCIPRPLPLCASLVTPPGTTS